MTGVKRSGFGKFGVASTADRTYQGEVFDSKAELHRWLELKLMERAGVVMELQRQVPFVLIQAFVCRGQKIRETVYRADFVYRRKEDGMTVVEDVKGVRTQEYLLKKKLFLREYGEKYVFFENRVKGF